MSFTHRHPLNYGFKDIFQQMDLSCGYPSSKKLKKKKEKKMSKPNLWPFGQKFEYKEEKSKIGNLHLK